MTTRRQFLRGRFSPRPAPLRPPWALAEEAFLAACTRCGDCLRACPTGILVADAGYPRVDFGRGGCTFCSDCVAACKAGALRRAPGRLPWLLLPRIAEKDCLTARGVVCRACGDACETDAISFAPRPGGVARPALDSSRCTGCGGCVAPCPARAITMQRRE